jgi:hypothetical protein
MRAAYLAAPHRCLQCAEPILPHAGEKIHETMRRKFCSRSCAASYNNRSAVAPKKKAQPRFCAQCGTRITSGVQDGPRTLCPACTEALVSRLPSLLRREASSADIRRHMRLVLSDRPRRCQHCGYDTHVEAVHRRPIDDFSPDATLAEIDAPANLAYLCPNHRWEFEHGLISLDTGPALPVRMGRGNRHKPYRATTQPLPVAAVAAH